MEDLELTPPHTNVFLNPDEIQEHGKIEREVHRNHHDKVRRFFQENFTQKLWWRVFVGGLLVTINAFAGFFSAYTAVSNKVKFFSFPDNPTKEVVCNVLVVYVPIAFFDLMSEFLILVAHDIPLCQGGKKKVNKNMLHVGLVAQIMTVLMWTALLIFIILDAVLPCSGVTALECTALTSSATEVALLVIIWLKNVVTLYNYYSRVYLYPIICPEQLLFFNQITRDRPHDVVLTFAKFNGLKIEHDKEQIFTCDCFNSPHFASVQNFVILLALDIAGLSSVASVFKSDDITYTIKGTLPFLSVVVLDMISEILLYLYHDLYLCKNKDFDKKWVISLAKVVQTLVSLTWLGLLIFLIFRVSNPDCMQKCTCQKYGANATVCALDIKVGGIDIPEQLPGECPGSNGICVSVNSSTSLGLCGYQEKGGCTLTTNTTITWITTAYGTKPNTTAPLSTCTVETLLECLAMAPRWTDCVLLAIVVFFSWVETINVFYRLTIYPITIPESVMFLFYWNFESEKGTRKRRWIPWAVGMLELGFNYKPPKGTEQSIEAALLKLEKKKTEMVHHGGVISSG